MDQTDQPILAWFISGVLYWLAFAGASIGAVVVALETRQVAYVFPTFAVVLIAGLALAGWVGKEKYVEDGAIAEAEEEADQGRGLYVGAGAAVAFLVTAGVVAGYVVA